MPTDEFLNPPPKKPTTTPPDPIIQQLNQLNARIRSIERSLTELRNLNRYHEERTNTLTKDLKTKQKDLADKQHKIEDALDTIQHTTSTIIRELQLTAKKEDVDIIKRIIDLLKPTRYLTEERAEQLIKEILQEHQSPMQETEWKRKI